MIWRETKVGWLAEGEPSTELLVVLLPDGDGAATDLRDVAATWSTSLPNTAFLVLDRLEDADRSVASTLDWVGLSRSRLLLVGFGAGGRHALSLAETAEDGCAGVLAYGIPLESAAGPTPVGHIRLRLIGDRTADPDESFSAVICGLVALGVDARGMQLSGPGLTRPAIRLGAAYLAELSASALMTGSGRGRGTGSPRRARLGIVTALGPRQGCRSPH